MANYVVEELLDSDHLRRLLNKAVTAGLPLAHHVKKNEKGEKMKQGKRWIITTTDDDAKEVEKLIKETAKG